MTANEDVTKKSLLFVAAKFFVLPQFWRGFKIEWKFLFYEDWTSNWGMNEKVWQNESDWARKKILSPENFLSIWKQLEFENGSIIFKHLEVDALGITLGLHSSAYRKIYVMFFYKSHFWKPT